MFDDHHPDDHNDFEDVLHYRYLQSWERMLEDGFGEGVNAQQLRSYQGMIRTITDLVRAEFDRANTIADVTEQIIYCLDNPLIPLLDTLAEEYGVESMGYGLNLLSEGIVDEQTIGDLLADHQGPILQSYVQGVIVMGYPEHTGELYIRHAQVQAQLEHAQRVLS